MSVPVSQPGEVRSNRLNKEAEFIFHQLLRSFYFGLPKDYFIFSLYIHLFKIKRHTNENKH